MAINYCYVIIYQNKTTGFWNSVCVILPCTYCGLPDSMIWKSERKKQSWFWWWSGNPQHIIYTGLSNTVVVPNGVPNTCQINHNSMTFVDLPYCQVFWRYSYHNPHIVRDFPITLCYVSQINALCWLIATPNYCWKYIYIAIYTLSLQLLSEFLLCICLGVTRYIIIYYPHDSPIIQTIFSASLLLKSVRLTPQMEQFFLDVPLYHYYIKY